MFEYTVVTMLMAIVMSFVIFFLLDKLIIKFFKVSERTGAIIALTATLIYSGVFNQIVLFFIFTFIWFIVALIAIHIDKKKEAEQKEQIPGGNNNN